MRICTKCTGGRIDESGLCRGCGSRQFERVPFPKDLLQMELARARGKRVEFVIGAADEEGDE